MAYSVGLMNGQFVEPRPRLLDPCPMSGIAAPRPRCAVQSRRIAENASETMLKAAGRFLGDLEQIGREVVSAIEAISGGSPDVVAHRSAVTTHAQRDARHMPVELWSID